jgi:hypothetical protein
MKASSESGLWATRTVVGMGRVYIPSTNVETSGTVE